MRLLLTVVFMILALPAVARDLPDVVEMDVAAIQAGYESGAFTARDITAAYLARIEAIDRNGPGLNSVRHVNEHALEQAAELDRERADGKVRGPLHGIPVLIKDNIDTADMPTTAAASGSTAWCRRKTPLSSSVFAKPARSFWARPT
jgi:amidase